LVLAPLAREATGEILDRGPSRSGVNHSGDATPRAEADEHDDPIAPGDHRSESRLSRQAPRRLDREAMDRPPTVHRDVFGCGDELATSIVHNRVDSTEALERRFDDAAHLVRLPQVGRDSETFTVHSQNLATRVVERLDPTPAHDDMCACSRQFDCRRSADASAASGHERYGPAVRFPIQGGAGHGRTILFRDLPHCSLRLRTVPARPPLLPP